MRRISRGFTLVELLVVIAVIGILATIVFIGVNRYQADSRDAQRSSEATIIANGLEKYYDKNGEYPGCSTMTGSASTVISTVLPGTNPSTLVTPQATSGTTNSINLCTDMTNSTPTDSFAYVGDGSTTCLTGSSCLQFKLEYKSESSNSIQTINSRRSTNITTSGSISGLTATTTDFSAVTLAWNTVPNATYNIQYSVNSNFSGASTTTSTTNSAVITGLTSGQIYYFEVQPVAPSSTGAWSSPVNATTWSLTTPTTSIGTVTYNSIAISWSTSTYGGGNASSYTAQISTDQTNWTPVSTAGTSYTFSNLSTGQTYYFRVQGISGSYTSSWSSTQSSSTTVPAPSTPSISATNSGGNTVGTTSASCSYGSPQYSLHYHSESGTTNGNYSSYTGWSSSNSLTISALQGYRYVFQAQAYCLMPNGSGSATSTSGEASTVYPISTPSSPSYAGPSSFTSTAHYYLNYTSYCPGGTNVYNGNFTSQDWNGTYYYHAFGFYDWWTLGPSGGANVQYWGRYQCQSSYTTSATSPDSYTVVNVHK